MPRRRVIETDEPPLEQKQIADMIEVGFSIELIVEHNYDDTGDDQYFLYAKYRNHLRPIYTQRGAHRFFTDFNRAKDWAHKLGFKSISMNTIEFSQTEEMSGVG